MVLEESFTTQEFLDQMTQALDEANLFFGHGTDNAWDEACWLLETVFKRNGEPVLTLESELDPARVSGVVSLLEERISTRKPMAYLLQEAWFCHIPFFVDERVLVPRSPIAELIMNGFEPLLDKAPETILDLCTGGGCIGLACALTFPDAKVVLADISEDALAVAAINIEKLGLGDRVTCIRSDLFNAIEQTFDLIVSNPPYVSDAEYDELPHEYHLEPKLGLVTGQDGIEIPLRILDQAADFLNPEGMLVLETGATWPVLDEACADFSLMWLEFEHGGEGVCAVSKESLALSKTHQAGTVRG